MGFMAQLREFGLDQLGIPCLAAKRHKLPSGKTRCYITETFPGLKRKETELYGEYLTQRLVLTAYDAIVAGMLK